MGVEGCTSLVAIVVLSTEASDDLGRVRLNRLRSLPLIPMIVMSCIAIVRTVTLQLLPAGMCKSLLSTRSLVSITVVCLLLLLALGCSLSTDLVHFQERLLYEMSSS